MDSKPWIKEEGMQILRSPDRQQQMGGWGEVALFSKSQKAMPEFVRNSAKLHPINTAV